MIEIGVRKPRGDSVLSRRAFLRASLVAGASLGLPGLLPAEPGARRKDTAVIQLWLGGGPSHLDMYDLKPRAPAEYRGAFTPIATNVPGTQICELLPLQARLMDRLALVRSLHHASNDHPVGMHWMLSGYPGGFAFDAMNGEPSNPSAGAITARLRGANRPGMVPYVHIAHDPLGFPLHVRLHGSAYLGPACEPLLVKSARAKADPNTTDVNNLIGKVQFDVPALELLPDLDVARLGEREHLRQRLDALGRRLEGATTEALEPHRRQAMGLVSSDAGRRAFDLSREAPRLRDRYGMNAWGQGLLLCRRLVEAGVTFVTLNTDSYGAQWDNHGGLKDEFVKMLPVYDRMLTALVEDLVERGLCERVLVLVWGEFGRTPKINGAAGRDHYGPAGFVLLGGGGVRGGAVVGATTARGEEPSERPVGPADVLATVYHVLGIDTETEFPDREGRPVKACTGTPIREIL
jgi:hypothetical protein